MIDPQSQADDLLQRADAIESLYSPEFNSPSMASALRAADNLLGAISRLLPQKPANVGDGGEVLVPAPLPFPGAGIEALLQSAEGSADALNDVLTRLSNLADWMLSMLIDQQIRLEQIERRLDRQRF